VPQYFIILGIGIGIWSGCLIPRWKDIVEMLTQHQGKILGVPPTDIIVAYCIGLLLVSIAFGQLMSGWWGWGIFLDGIVPPILLMRIDRNEIMGDLDV
jgi:hypothetical protein